MSPSLEPGDIVIHLPFRYKVGSMVLVKKNDREVIKRVGNIKNGLVYLEGDNTHESTDSRHYGPVPKSDIIGKVMIVFPKPTNPPKLVKPYGVWLGRAAAVVLAFMALIHLFRIDTLVPILDDLLPGGYMFAGVVTSGIIFSEIFAIPFALRMKLSPLMQVLSGILVALAPLWWLLIAIWTYGSNQNVGQLGEFVILYASTLLVLINTLWVAFNYYALYSLGFDKLKI